MAVRWNHGTARISPDSFHLSIYYYYYEPSTILPIFPPLPFSIRSLALTRSSSRLYKPPSPLCFHFFSRSSFFFLFRSSLLITSSPSPPSLPYRHRELLESLFSSCRVPSTWACRALACKLPLVSWRAWTSCSSVMIRVLPVVS